MSNSSFEKIRVQTPISPSQGGTGLTSLTNNAILIFKDGGFDFISPGDSGKVLVSTGSGWESGDPGVSNGSVSYENFDSSLVGYTSLESTNVDWSSGSIFTVELTEDTTLTFSNYQLNKTIILRVYGDYVLSLPASVTIISGSYDGSFINSIILHCVDDTNGSEEVYGIIKTRSS